MDFYVDLAITVLLRLLKDRKSAQKYYPAIAKVYLAIRTMSELDLSLMAEITKRERQA